MESSESQSKCAQNAKSLNQIMVSKWYVTVESVFPRNKITRWNYIIWFIYKINNLWNGYSSFSELPLKNFIACMQGAFFNARKSSFHHLVTLA